MKFLSLQCRCEESEVVTGLLRKVEDQYIYHIREDREYEAQDVGMQGI
jgi:hypothetical protein